MKNGAVRMSRQFCKKTLDLHLVLTVCLSKCMWTCLFNWINHRNKSQWLFSSTKVRIKTIPIHLIMIHTTQKHLQLATMILWNLINYTFNLSALSSFFFTSMTFTTFFFFFMIMTDIIISVVVFFSLTKCVMTVSLLPLVISKTKHRNQLNLM